MRGTSENTQKTILRAAAKLFYNQGIRKVSVDAVANEAGITKRTLYYHFKSKNALVAAYLESRNTPILLHLRKAVTGVNGGASKQVPALFAMLARQVKSSAWKGCPFARAVAELPSDVDHPALQLAIAHKNEFECWLRMRFQKEGLRQPTRLARQIMVLLDGAITQMLIHRDAAYAKAAGSAASTLIASSQAAVLKR